MSNNEVATKLLGYLPKGYVLVTENYNHSAPFRRLGAIYVDGKCLLMFDMEANRDLLR